MTTHRFSEETQLLIDTSGFVLNGAWQMQQAQIDSIKDWVDVNPADWDDEKQRAWYYKR